MRHIVIMRHAKAERGEGKPDFERMLETRGVNDAELVGRQLAEAGLVPDVVLCSAARRTRDTFAAMLGHFGGDCLVHVRRNLYEAEIAELREAVRDTRGECVLLVGHNPSVHGLALEFAGADPAAAPLKGGFPTASAAVFTMGFGLDTAKFDRLVTP
ncbi:histidine phosphatase family protein [Acuticoccus sp. M5D2P5]|uniref:SixA phosphatase family protein n=1 Tax=Acuticoccus kalidii TaxID=2910977 RepID=UPI001F403E9F|nr:histidine phosphatase family protein [Acuticoccus kalidii]MCF3933533.1 histidine phosphatase family protein [Acuticoccus kalidii]